MLCWVCMAVWGLNDNYFYEGNPDCSDRLYNITKVALDEGEEEGNDNDNQKRLIMVW